MKIQQFCGRETQLRISRALILMPSGEQLYFTNTSSFWSQVGFSRWNNCCLNNCIFFFLFLFHQVVTNFERLADSDQIENHSDVLQMLRDLLAVPLPLDDNVSHEPPARWNQFVKSGSSGRPRFRIPKDVLTELISSGTPVNRIAREGLLGCHLHPSTVRRFMRREGIETPLFSTISDEDLRFVIEEYNKENPNAGN